MVLEISAVKYRLYLGSRKYELGFVFLLIESDRRQKRSCNLFALGMDAASFCGNIKIFFPLKALCKRYSGQPDPMGNALNCISWYAVFAFGSFKAVFCFLWARLSADEKSYSVAFILGKKLLLLDRKENLKLINLSLLCINEIALLYLCEKL